RWIRASLDPGVGSALDIEVQVHVPQGSLLAVAAYQFGPLPLDLLDRLPPGPLHKEDGELIIDAGGRRVG
ncbi:MAG: hypothetical protein AAFZ09_15555, partial [Pseudomonadota bacterium]